jgi:hypothetical protein
MKHITYGEKSLMIGDEAASVLMEFAARVAEVGTADTVAINAIGAEGNDVTATFLLDVGTVMMSETATTSVQEPDNAAAIAYMRGRMESMEAASAGRPFDQDQMTDFDRSMFED